MSFKTIFIITISVLITVVLMKNTDEVEFWLFGIKSISKLAVSGVMFALGILVGILIARPRKKPLTYVDEGLHPEKENPPSTLSDEDREYIS